MQQSMRTTQNRRRRIPFTRTMLFQLRKSVRQLVEKELAPHAQKIDKDNEWKKLRVSGRRRRRRPRRTSGEAARAHGLLGITAPTKYGGSALKVL